jgi:hypothetical protein
MSRLTMVVLALVALAAFFAACGDDAASKPAGPVLSDHDYLAVVCKGLSDFSSALLTKTKAEDLTQVIKDYAASLKKIQPPADVAQFHKDFIKYLEDAYSEPTALVTKAPPLPPTDVRQRLAAEEGRTAECQDARFFARSN